MSDEFVIAKTVEPKLPSIILDFGQILIIEVRYNENIHYIGVLELALVIEALKKISTPV